MDQSEFSSGLGLYFYLLWVVMKACFTPQFYYFSFQEEFKQNKTLFGGFLLPYSTSWKFLQNRSLSKRRPFAASLTPLYLHWQSLNLTALLLKINIFVHVYLLLHALSMCIQFFHS